VSVRKLGLFSVFLRSDMGDFVEMAENGGGDRSQGLIRL
jgi:hypothetical protein